MKRIYTTTLRLNLADEEDRRAFERLQNMDKKRYRSYSKAIAAAVNDHFERQERLAADPYLETREEEDVFLQRVMEAVATGLQGSAGQIKPPAPPLPPMEVDSEELSAALDFADGF